MHKSMLYFCGVTTVLTSILTGCIFSEKETASENDSIKTQSISKSVKVPLIFDERKIIYPSFLQNQRPQYQALQMTATTEYYIYRPGSGLANYNDRIALLMSNSHPDVKGPGSDWFEADNFKSLFISPDAIWSDRPSSKLVTIPRKGNNATQPGLLDNQQVEMHFTWVPTIKGKSWSVTVSYSINTELGYDYLYINSTSSDGSCNSPGVIRKKVSGFGDGTVNFIINGTLNCANLWLGFYYIKDGSVTEPTGEYVNLHHLTITQL